MEFDNTQIFIWNTMVTTGNSQCILADSKSQNTSFWCMILDKKWILINKYEFSSMKIILRYFSVSRKHSIIFLLRLYINIVN